jgi:NAD(P)-dependent dehydrogenase (short-subunit alcohol dehydrogenase family)
MTVWPDLRGRNLIVTGASGEIGGAIARAAAEAGANLLVTDVIDSVLGLPEGLAGQGHHATVVDLADPAAGERLVSDAVELFGEMHGLIHLAAVLRRARDIREVTVADWDLQHTVNLRGSFLLSRAAAESMRSTGGGSIVLFSSQGWWSGGFGGSVVYAATKGGVVSMSRGLARTYGPHGITVNTVAPGFVDSPMLVEGLDPTDLDSYVKATPLGRLGRAEDLVGPVLFLVSDHARFVSGATLNVSGGALMY